MFEHVGLKNLPVYFGTVAPPAQATAASSMNHGITSVDPESRAVGLGAGDFIDHYVFPHGELPHLLAGAQGNEPPRGLEVDDVESPAPALREDPLACGRDRLEAHLEEAAQASGERRLRIWRLYLAGCAHAFEQSWVSIHQVLAVKTRDPRVNPLPFTREYMYAK